MRNAYTNVLTTSPLQTEQANDRQVKNNAGGFVYEISDLDRLQRFLILGSAGGSYYASERDLTKQNVDFLNKMIASDPMTVVATVVDVSSQGRAYSNSPAIFVLALTLNGCYAKFNNEVISAIDKVCRTATHIYEFTEYVNAMGWSRAKRRAIQQWFNSKSVSDLAYQAVKYRQRNGWTLRDLMRLSHPTDVDQAVGSFILDKPFSGDFPEIINGFKEIQAAQSVSEVALVLNAYQGLPWEAIPTQFLSDPEIWKILFYNGQLKGQALVRNVVRLAKNGAFRSMEFAREFADALVDEQMITKTRLHPMNYLNALIVYNNGQKARIQDSWSYSVRQPRTWDTVPAIADALDAGFYKSFKNIEPANKRTLIGIDVSGSMSYSMTSGLDIMCAQAAAAEAMFFARTEPFTQVFGFANTFRPLNISPSMGLNQVMRVTDVNNFGTTDCSLPMVHAKRNGIDVDTFVVITDNETYAGKVHPDKALRDYRQFIGHDAKLVVVGMTASPFSIADPLDSGMMDVVGFDSNGPRVIADFSAGRI